MSIYEEALENAQILSSLVNVYEPNATRKYQMLTNIEDVLQKAIKQAKLVEMYQTLDELVEEYNTSDSILRKIKLHSDISELRLEIKAIKEELK